MLPDMHELKDVIIQAAEQELLPRFTADVVCTRKADRSIVTEADVAMQQRVREELTRRWPQHGFLGEEMSTQEHRRLLGALDGGLWCLDPLDGTTNFVSGVSYFSVSLALVKAEGPVLGLVYDPMRRECFAAQKGQGAWLGDTRLGTIEKGLTLAQCIAGIDFKRLPPELAVRLVRESPYGSQRNLGSAALDWCWLAAGRFDVYLHGGQKLWDYAAGSLVLQEAGGHAVTVQGEPVFSAGIQPRSVVAALDSRLFDEWRRWIAR